MKKLITMTLLIGLVIFSTESLFSQTDAEVVTANLDVNASFSLDLSGGGADGISWTGADSAAPGSTVGAPEGIIDMLINTNHELEWTLQMSAAPLTHTDLTTTIAATDFRYFINGGVGTRVPDGTDAPVPTATTTIYTADATEYSVFNLGGFQLGFFVNVPFTQKSGSYSTTVNLAMIDAF